MSGTPKSKSPRRSPRKTFPTAACTKTGVLLFSSPQAAAASSSVTTFSFEQYQKRFRCGLCSISFDLNPDLVKHIERHALTKPFQCGVCRKSFDTNPELLSHVNVHKLFVLPLNATSVTNNHCDNDNGAVAAKKRVSVVLEPCDALIDGKGDAVAKKKPNLSNVVFESCDANDNIAVKEEPEDDGDETEVDDDADDDDDDSHASEFFTVNGNAHSTDAGVGAKDKTLKTTNNTAHARNSVSSSPNRIWFSCRACAVKFETVELLLDHNVKVHTSTSTSSKASTFSNENAIGSKKGSSKRCKSGSDPLACPLCPLEVPSLVSLNKHMKKCHSDCCVEHYTVDCKPCKRLEDAVKKGKTGRAWNCVDCGKQLKTEKNLRGHYRVVHIANRPFACPVCPLKFKTKGNRKEHIQNMHSDSMPEVNVVKKGPSSWQCHKCEKLFADQHDVQAHYEAAHLHTRQFECPQCPLKFRRERDLTVHTRKLHGLDKDQTSTGKHDGAGLSDKDRSSHTGNLHGSDSRPFSCSDCDANFKTKTSLENHNTCFHRQVCREHNMKVCDICPSNLPYACTKCPLKFATYRQRFNHSRRDHYKKSQFVCPYCSFGFHFHHALDSHVERYHTQTNAQSSNIPVEEGHNQKSKTDVSSAHISLSSETSDKDVSTAAQDGSAETETMMEYQEPSTELETSLGSDSKLTSFRCPDCPAKFTTEDDYCEHIKRDHVTNLKERDRIVCDICGQSRRAKSMKFHMDMHAREGTTKDFHCDQCQLQFWNARALEAHSKVHSDDKPYICEFCGRSFRRRSTLDYHRTTHVEDKLYCCEFCGKSFRRRDTLNYHRNTHVDARSIKCKICFKGFNNHAAHSMHMRRHNEDRRYQCQTCGKKFYSSSLLKKHQIKHGDDRPYVCVYCSRTYRSYTSLRYHLKVQHNSNKNVLGENVGENCELMNH